MDFKEFKEKYQKTPVIEYPNNRANKTSTVTVKVITYNHVNFIADCLESILMQKTNFDFEILIAEDNSSDGTRQVCIEYAEKHPDKIKLLLNSRENNIKFNGKPTGIFNNTYANYTIKSKYISFIEGDDYWTDETSLQKRFNFLEENKNFVMCYHNAIIEDSINENNTNKKMVNYFNSKIIAQKNIISHITSIPTLTVFYRNNLIDIFDKEMIKITCGDVVTRAKLSHFGKIMFLSDIKPGVYRKHKGGIFSSKTAIEKINASIEAREYLNQHFTEKKWPKTFIKNSLIEFHFTLFIASFKNENKIKTKALFKIIKHSFYSKKTIKFTLIFLINKIHAFSK